MRALFDTHILIDYLKGDPKAKQEIERYEARLISAVSMAELCAAATAEERPIIQAWLEQFEVVASDAKVAALSADLKIAHGLEMKSALIWASAKAHDALFITRNTSAYPSDVTDIRKPY